MVDKNRYRHRVFHLVVGAKSEIVTFLDSLSTVFLSDSARGVCGNLRDVKVPALESCSVESVEIASFPLLSVFFLSFFHPHPFFPYHILCKYHYYSTTALFQRHCLVSLFAYVSVLCWNSECLHRERFSQNGFPLIVADDAVETETFILIKCYRDSIQVFQFAKVSKSLLSNCSQAPRFEWF